MIGMIGIYAICLYEMEAFNTDLKTTKSYYSETTHPRWFCAGSSTAPTCLGLM